MAIYIGRNIWGIKRPGGNHSDYGTRQTDLAVRRAEWRLSRVYRQAQRDIDEKLKDWQKRHEEREKRYRQQLAEGKITQADFDAWMRGQVFQDKQWQARKAEIDRILLNADREAQRIVNEGKISVFSDNANYIGYDLERNGNVNTGFTLYDQNTVGRLIKSDPQILPKPAPGVQKDKAYTYYNKLMNSAITQGIVQGETIPQIAKRIVDKTGESSYSSAVRNARTAYTGAQNAGRMEGLHQAQELGIKVKKQWMATLDDRTRDTHADLDGQIRDVDEPFEVDGMEIDYPGDPTADPSLVYNCRCTLVYVYPDYPSDMQRRDNETGEIVGDMTYREWEAMKQGESNAAQTDDNDFNIRYAEKPQYTDEEASALHDYTTSSYSGINSLLRDGGLENYPDAKRIVDKIDSAMDKSELVSPITVSRGERMNGLQTLFPDIKRRWLEDPEKLRQLEGRTAPCPQFISTTAGEKVSEAFSGRGLVWHYEVEDGVNAIDMSRFASTAIRDVEREVLIDRDVEVIIDRLDIKTDSDGDIVGDVIAYARIRGKHGNR